MKATVRAKDSSTLVNKAAVRGEGENSYVYVGDAEQSLFGDTRYKVRKVNLKVLGENEKTVSTDNNELTWGSPVIYLEDREIAEGSYVMLRDGKEGKE